MRLSLSFCSYQLRKIFGIGLIVIGIMSGGSLIAQTIPPPDAGCENYQAWTIQSNPHSDAPGKNGHAYPEYNATYWVVPVTLPLGTVVTARGQFPNARYMSFQLYDLNRNVLSAINDVQIDPDPGQNNPYRGGTQQGTYTVRVVFGSEPRRGPPPNTIYTDGLQQVGLVYRIYYANDPDDLPGGPVNPVLPEVLVNGVPWSVCPVRPILPEESTLSGRLDNIDFVGVPPTNSLPTTFTPTWQFSVTGPNTPYYPSADNSYLVALISRDYLKPPYNMDMVVVRMKTPTFTDTQNGAPPYAPAQMRFWSMCQDEPITTSVVRCIPDDRAPTIGGFATFVISDPSNRPSDAVLAQWGASWIPWGALLPTDTIYDINDLPLTNADGVFYNGAILYRQTEADPNFSQSIVNIAKLPPSQRPAAMGDYYPTIGYCTATRFAAFGAGCIRQRGIAAEESQ